MAPACDRVVAGRLLDLVDTQELGADAANRGRDQVLWTNLRNVAQSRLRSWVERDPSDVRAFSLQASNER